MTGGVRNPRQRTMNSSKTLVHLWVALLTLPPSIMAPFTPRNQLPQAPELIRAGGYPVEVHHITTEDGYILEVHRIPHGRDRASASTPKTPKTPTAPPAPTAIHGEGLSASQAVNDLSQAPVDGKSDNFNSLSAGVRTKRSSLSAGVRNKRSSLSAGVRNKRSPPVEHRVVFLHHCLCCSSIDFVLNDPSQALAFVLADAGWDVWLGNARGSTVSRGHVSMDTSMSKYWDFSWDQMARYDLPAVLGYIRKTADVNKLDYIGHSMGTTIFFAMMNYHPEINNWINAMAAMAPVTYVTKKRTILWRSYRFVDNIDEALVMLGQREFGSDIADNPYSRIITTMIFNLKIYMTGSLTSFADKNFMPMIKEHIPDSTSVHTIAQFGQLEKSGRFQAFDFGIERNLKEYGSATPSVYNLSVVTCPIGLFWSSHDVVLQPADTLRMMSELPNLKVNHKVAEEQFKHMDFLWGENAKELVYDHIIEFFLQHED